MCAPANDSSFWKNSEMKRIAVLAVFAAFVGFGQRLSQAQRLELRCLEGISLGVRIIREELAARLCPMDALLAMAAEGTEGDASRFFGCAADSLSELNEKSFFEIWRNACRKLLPDLSQEERELIEALGMTLGRCELNDQLSACDRFLTQSEQRSRILRASLPEKRRLTLALCTAAGLFLSLLIL